MERVSDSSKILRKAAARSTIASLSLLLAVGACASDPAADPKVDPQPKDAGAEADTDPDAGTGGTGGADTGDGGLTITWEPAVALGDTEASLATLGQRLGSVASGTEESAVLWADARSNGLYVAHVSPTGEVLDPKGIRLDIEVTGGALLRASHDGYLLVSSDAPSGLCPARSLRAAFMPRGAGAVPGTPIELASNATDCVAEVNLAFDGQQFVVVWNQWTQPEGSAGSGPDHDTRTHLVRLSPTGELIDDTPQTLSGVSAGMIAGAEGDLLLAYRSPEGGRVSRLHVQDSSYAESPVAVGGDTIVGDSNLPLAYGDGVFLVVWMAAFGKDMLAARVDMQGNVLDAEPLAVGADASWRGVDYRVEWVDDAFRVSWAASDDTHGKHGRTARVYADGTVSPEEVTALETLQLAWTWNGAEARAFGTSATPFARVYGADDASPWTPEPISHVVNSQMEVDLVRDGEGVLATWSDGRNDVSRIAVERRAGSYAGQTVWKAYVGEVAGVGYPQARPVAASREGQTLVAWLDAQDDPLQVDVRAVRVAPTGEVLDAVAIPLGSDSPSGVTDDTFAQPSDLAIAAGASDYLAAYRIWWANATYDPKVCVVRVSDQGETLPAGCAAGLQPSIAAIGDTYAMVWSASDGQRNRVLGRWLAPGEQLQGPVWSPSSSESHINESSPQAASDGDTLLVAWQANVVKSDSTLGVAAYAALIAPTGATVMPATRLGDDEGVDALGASFDGTRYRLVWQNDDEIRTVTMDGTGALPGEPVSVGKIPGWTSSLSAIGLDPEHLLLGYDELDDGLGNRRGRLQLVSFGE
jgi:hypothetical protein